MATQIVTKQYEIETDGKHCGRWCKFHDLDITMGRSHDWCVLFNKTNLYFDPNEGKHLRCKQCLEATGELNLKDG
jgi:hypothetical protein